MGLFFFLLDPFQDWLQLRTTPRTIYNALVSDLGLDWTHREGAWGNGTRNDRIKQGRTTMLFWL